MMTPDSHTSSTNPHFALMRLSCNAALLRQSLGSEMKHHGPGNGLCQLLYAAQQLEREIKCYLKYDPNQPRVPAGSSDGGQWTAVGTGVGGADNQISASISDMKEPNMKMALAHLRDQAKPTAQNQCARYVRMALNAGGFNVHKTRHAKDYGAKLIDAAFTPVAVWDGVLPNILDQNGYLPSYVVTAGDVAVIQPYDGGNPSGHMTMYDGQHWLSDFRQRGIWPGQGYRNKKPSYIIYRYLNP